MNFSKFKTYFFLVTTFLILFICALAITIGCASGGYAPGSPLYFAYVPNFTSNNVSVFSINPSTGILTQVSGSPFTAGATSANSAVDSTGQFAYVANASGANQVSAYTIDPVMGTLSQIPNSPLYCRINAKGCHS